MFFENLWKTYVKPMENHWKINAKPLKNHYTKWCSLQKVEKRYILNLSTFPLFLKRWKWIRQMEFRKNLFWKTRKRRKSATVSQKHIFKYFGEGWFLLLCDCIILMFLFPPATSKMSTFEKVHFHHSAPSQKSTFWEVLIFHFSQIYFNILY